MEVGGNSEVFAGIDTVAIGGVATFKQSLVEQLEQQADGTLYKRFHRHGVTLSASIKFGKCMFRVQCSLPKLLYGSNFKPATCQDVAYGTAHFLAVVRTFYPEIANIDLENANVTRLDIAFDFPVCGTRKLIQSFFDCYLAASGTPGKIERGQSTWTFYSKDITANQRCDYYLLRCYPKTWLSSGEPGLRVESELHSRILKAKSLEMKLSDIGSTFGKLEKLAWQMADRRLRFIEPISEDEFWNRVQKANQETRDLLFDVWFLGGEVPLLRLPQILEIDLKDLKPLLIQYGIGYGSESAPELYQFASIRDVLRDYFSSSY